MKLKPEIRKDQILTAAVSLAEEVGFNRFTRDGVAERAGCAMGTVNVYFNTMKQLRRAVMRAAIQQQRLGIIADGLAARDTVAMGADSELKKMALSSLAG